GLSNNTGDYLENLLRFSVTAIRLLLHFAGAFLDDLIINKNPAAVFAHYNFLARFDVELSLGRNLVKAASACITLNRNNSQTISCVAAYPLVGREEAVFNELLDIFRLVV